MNKQEIDAMLDAQRAYEKARVGAYFGTADMEPRMYQFVKLGTLRSIERALGAEARLVDEGTRPAFQLEYGGCVFQSSAGRAD